MEIKIKFFIYICVFSLIITLASGTGYFMLIKNRSQQSLISGLFALGTTADRAQFEQSVKTICTAVPFITRYYFVSDAENALQSAQQFGPFRSDRIKLRLRNFDRTIVVEFMSLWAFMLTAHHIFLLSILLLINLGLCSGAYTIMSYKVLTPLAELRHSVREAVAGNITHGVAFSNRAGYMGRLGKQLNQLFYELDRSRTQQDSIDKGLDATRDEDPSTSLSKRLASTGRLAAGIAHEINNPLGGMINAARSLLRNDDGMVERTREYLELIMDGLMRIQDTIRKINHFQFSNTRNTYHPVSISETVRKSILFLQHQLDEQQIQIYEDIPATLPPVFGNSGDLQQVFLNLFKNAVEAIDGEGIISVTAYMHKNKVEILIADNGCGMTEEELHQAFELFYTTKSSMRGSGLGLAIVHNIVKHHGGSIEVSSTKHIGTEVKIKLPTQQTLATFS